MSNAVSALRPPEGRNARRILEIQGAIVMFLIAGISWIAHITHAVPYASGVPTVVSQEAGLVFGHSAAGQILFYLVQAGAITILFTGGNTSFSGFPFLTSFVAEDSFLPRWLSKRGHRLVFSNGIIVLTILALALLFVVGASTTKLVALYAIGVFTGFSMAGFGMVRYHLRQREPGWRRKLIINLTGGIYTALVVLIFAVVKFTEGAWLVVIVFPIGVFAFIRLNRQYRTESRVLENIGVRRASGEPQRQPNYTRRVVIVFVDDFDLATLGRAALRQEPAPHHGPRGALRHRQRAGRTAARRLAAGPQRHPGVRGLPRPQADPVRRRPGGPRGESAGHAGDRDPAPAQLLGIARPAAARPHRGQDRRRGQPGAERRRHDHPVRRAEPAARAAATPGRAGRAPRPPA